MIEIKKAFARAWLFFLGTSIFDLVKMSIDEFLVAGWSDWFSLTLEVLLVLVLVFLSFMALDRAFDPAISARWLLGKGDIVEVLEEESRPRGVALKVRLPYKNTRPLFVKFSKKQNVTPREGQYLYDGRGLKPMAVAS